MPDNSIRVWNERLRTMPRAVVLLLLVLVAAGVLTLILGSRDLLITLLVVIVMLVCAAILWLRFIYTNFTLHRIRGTFRGVDQWAVLSRVYPLYKWVDLYRAADAIAESYPFCAKLETEHNMPLKYLLQESFVESLRMPLKPPTMLPRKVSPTEETFLPSDTIWLIQNDGSLKQGAILRVHLISYNQMVQLEVAALESGSATKIIDALLEHAAKHSIYRQHIISPVFQRQIKSSFRDDEGNTGFDLVFEPDPLVTDEKSFWTKMCGAWLSAR